MGMFDSIKCNYPLPLPLEVVDILPDIYEAEFQTKDLENLMELYILNEDGSLSYRKREYKWKDDDSCFFKGYMEVVREEIVPENFHGVLNFNCYETIRDSQIYIENGNPEDAVHGTDVSIDYLAKFTNGKLTNIEILDYEILDATDRLTKIRKLHKEHDKRRNLWYNKYFFYTKFWKLVKTKIILPPFKLLKDFFDKLYWLVVKYF